jgi:hypothetical protein
MVVTSIELEGSRRVGGRSEDVQDLSRFRQGMEERRTGRGNGRAGGIARRNLPCIACLLIRPLRRPRAVTDRLGPLGSLRERLRSLDRGSWAPIVRAFTFEDRQRGLRAGHGIARNLAQFSHAEFDYRILISHTVNGIAEPTVETSQRFSQNSEAEPSRQRTAQAG